MFIIYVTVTFATSFYTFSRFFKQIHFSFSFETNKFFKMRWYNGGIVDAINLTKQKGAIFVVYIEGNDDKSQEIAQLINNETITNKLESDSFVAIKLEANSVPHQQFSEIYKQATAPSLFFIGKSGIPLEIITEVKDLQTLSTQIDNIVQKAGLSLSASSSSSAHSESLIRSEQHPEPANIVCENGVCSIRPSTQPEQPDSSPTSSLSAEEKLNRAKELVEKTRLLKQKEEEESLRQKELERRKMGQNVQQMKRWQEDQEMKQLKEEREREKRENQAARDRVLAQIAQDKAERASKFSSSPPTQPKITPQQPSTSRPQSNTARLQFKLPDGSSNTQEFPSSDSLDQVVTYIKTKLNITKFKLATTFPRREFTTNDYSQSLMDLQLVPNAVILVLPVSSGAVVASTAATSGLNAFFWSLIGPIWSIFQYIRGYLFGGGAETGGAAVDGDNRRPTGQQSSKGGSVLHVRSKYDLENKLKMAGSTKLVVIDFFATWCGPCRMIAPKLEELAREFPYVMFLKVDVDENRDIASDYQVASMPTFAFVKNRRTLTNFSGADYYRLRDEIVRYK